MKIIDLPTGEQVLVDDEDYELVSQYSWIYCNGYAKTIVGTRSTGRKNISMHRLIMNAGPDEIVDHRYGNGLNNQRYNLRKATRTQNMQNSKLRSDNSVGYKGVNIHQNRYQARIEVNRKYIRLGSFDNPEDAARAYDRKAIELFGEFARTNFPLEDYKDDNND